MDLLPILVIQRCVLIEMYKVLWVNSHITYFIRRGKGANLLVLMDVCY